MNTAKSKLKIHFKLKTEKSPNRPVIAVVNYGYRHIDVLTMKVTYKPVLIPTGVKLKESEWDNVKKRPKSITTLARLEEVAEIIDSVYANLVRRIPDFTFEELKAELEEAVNGKKIKPAPVSKTSLSDFIRDHILTSTAIKATSKTPYKNLAGKLEQFERKIGRKLYAEDLNEDLFLQFMEFYRPYATKINAVWAIQKVFKATLKEFSRKFKVAVFDPGKELSVRDKVQAETADSVYLTMHHIKKIIATIPKEERLRNTRFILLILLFTGCRESDVYKIVPQNHHEAGGESFNYVRYITQKTGAEVLVPILKPLQDEFDRNEGKPPRPISQQNFNQYLKEFILRCELDEDVTTSFTNAEGRKAFVTKKLYEFATSHIGRRSFITNLINFIPLPTLTKITGHKLQDKNIIFAYNKMTLLENATMFLKLLRRAAGEYKEYFPIKLV